MLLCTYDMKGYKLSINKMSFCRYCIKAKSRPMASDNIDMTDFYDDDYDIDDDDEDEDDDEDNEGEDSEDSGTGKA